ncbi:MAG: MBL fold metallo-hydrolase [Clostridia bacterium]|nr:MBL fold metallo-hydrolase [Clostridia bacterium]
MKNLTVTDVRGHLGDSAFLIDDGKTAILCDAGFGFSGYTIAENVKKQLGDRPLDYIFLTHSHYDHALGSPYVKARYPMARVVAGEYAARIFAKDSAKAVMRDLDRKFAATCGVTDYDDLADKLGVDVPVADGDTVQAGDMTFTVLSLPGHTKCSIGFYLPEQKLLIAPESLGIYDGDKTIMPSYLVGYQMSLDSIERVKALEIDNILFPHFGLADKEKSAYFLSVARKSAVDSANKIVEILNAGGSKEDAVEWFKDTFYHGKIKESYPIDAMKLNTGITVALIERELLLAAEC